MRTLKDTDKCEVEGCETPLEDIGLHFDRVEQEVLVICVNHSDSILEKDYPEYQFTCSNCGCESGVN